MKLNALFILLPLLSMYGCGRTNEKITDKVTEGDGLNRDSSNPKLDGQMPVEPQRVFRPLSQVSAELEKYKKETRENPPVLPEGFKPYPTVNFDELVKGFKPAEFPKEGTGRRSSASPGLNFLPFADVDSEIGVDLRQYDSPVVSQEDRGWCTAFANMASMENLTRQYGKPFDLSEEHHWSTYGVPYMHESANAGMNSGATDFAIWPWRAGSATVNPVPIKVRSTGWKEIYSLDEARKYLDKKIPIQFATRVNASFQLAPGGKIGLDPVYNDGGHAISLVGYHEQNNSGFMIIKNSWSRGWGDGGYGYIPYEYCNISGNYCAFYVNTGIEINGEPLPIPDVPDSGGGGRHEPDRDPPNSQCRDIFPDNRQQDGAITNAVYTQFEFDKPVSKILSVRGRWRHDSGFDSYSYTGDSTGFADLVHSKPIEGANFGALIFYEPQGTHLIAVPKNLPYNIKKPTKSINFTGNIMPTALKNPSGKLRVCFDKAPEEN